MKKAKFDPELAQTLIGKTILVGLRWHDAGGNFIEQTQFHGKVVRASESEGIVLLRSDGKGEHALPPDTENLKPAASGSYRERSTGQVIVNPDFIAEWAVTRGMWN